MLTPTRILCRLWRCARPGQASDRAEDLAGEPAESSGDDLTVIRGIGPTTRDHLNRAGITSVSQLARSSPEQIREVLGAKARGAEVESWIEQAAGLAKGV